MRPLGLLLLAAALARADDRLLDELEAEVARLRYAGREAAAERLEQETSRLRRRAWSRSDEPTVSVIAARAGKPSVYGGLRRDTVVIEVTARIELVLVSPRPVRWEIRVEEGGEVARIWTSGDSRHWVQGVETSKVYRLGPVIAYRRDDADFRKLERMVEEKVERPIVWFEGRLEAVDAPFVVGPVHPRWLDAARRAAIGRLHWNATRGRRARLREALAHLRYDATTEVREGESRRLSFGPCTPAGPLLEEREELPFRTFTVVRDAKSGASFGLDEGGLARHDGAGGVELLDVPDMWPRVRGAYGLALDTRRRRVLMATRGGAGYLYAFDIDAGTWRVLGDMDHVGVAGLAYDALRDRLFCVSYAEKGGFALHVIAPDGTWLGDVAVDPVRLPGRVERAVQAHAAAGKLVVTYPSRPARAYVLEPETGQLLATLDQRPYASLEPLTRAEMERAWRALRSESARAARRAGLRLADGGDDAVAFLRARLLSREPSDSQAFPVWIEHLGADGAGLREHAQHRLEAAGDAALPVLADVAGRATSPEVRVRARFAAKRIRERASLDEQRVERAIDVLERIDTPAAYALLLELREESPEAALAVRRMSRPR